MINTSKSWLLSLTLVSGLFSANFASAQNVPTQPQLPAAPTLPSECSARRDSTAWSTGRANGEARMNSVWKSTAVNQDLDNLTDQLPSVLQSLQQYLSSLSAGGTPTTYIKCRAQGYTEGFLLVLNKLFKQCVLDGANWGQFAADMYCRMSLEQGGIDSQTLFFRAPAGVCALRFEVTCEETYRFVGTEGAHEVNPVVQSYLDQEGIVLEPYPGCGVYTDNEWLESFESSLHNDCTYEIAQ
ncbi:MAG TPA: hypothetical protein VFN67_42915 [Polyangiales bacterium]|jgi:hypothetical protein|nr:hypothetical protein [Polyangiales bacterium]